MPVDIKDIKQALVNLGGTAKAENISPEVAKVMKMEPYPSSYKNYRSFYGTVQAKIEHFCPESDNYKEGTEKIFTRLGDGFYTFFDLKKEQEEIEKVTNLLWPNEVEDSKNEFTNKGSTETEKKAIVDSRIGQGVFREQLIIKWKACSVTSCIQINLLIASHIKPWAKSNNSERLDVDNGFLLIPNLDSLFDKGYVTFQNDGQIKISSKLNADTAKLLGVNKEMRVRDLNSRNIYYLEYHRDKIFKRA